MGDIELLIHKLEERIKQVDGALKGKYATLVAALKYQDFTSNLAPQNIQQINQLLDHLQSRGDLGLDWIEQNQLAFVDTLTDLYWKALSFNNDKKKNIAYFETKTHELEKNIESAQQDINHISETAKLISGASILTEYSKAFKTEADNHKKNANMWFKRLVWSVVGFMILVGFVLFFNLSDIPLLKKLLAQDILQNKYYSLIVLAIKASLIAGFLQIPSFLRRNYFAEKHLEQANIHRKNVLQTLHAVYNTIQDPTEKDRIITVGSSIAFSETESGFLTRKEGAGDGGDLVSNIMSLITKAPRS